MKKFVTLLFIGTFLPLMALDFDFTANPPTAKGKVPMLKLDDSLKIGGTNERTALNFDGKSKIQVPDSDFLSLDNGLTVAIEIDSKDKGDGKNLQMIILKRNEWCLYRSGNKLSFLWKSGKKWIAVYHKNMSFDTPHKFVLTLSKDRKLNFHLDGKHIRVVKLDNFDAPNKQSKEVITLGGGWNNWDFKGDIYQLKILNKVWNKEEIQEFFK